MKLCMYDAVALIMSGELTEADLRCVNSVKHGQDVAVKYLDHHDPECGVRTVTQLTLPKGFEIPEFDLGDNGSEWASQFAHHSVDLLSDRRALRTAVQGAIVKCASMRPMIAFLRDAPVFYRHGINPLPHMRGALNHRDYDYEYELGYAYNPFAAEGMDLSKTISVRAGDKGVTFGIQFNGNDSRDLCMVKVIATPRGRLKGLMEEYFRCSSVDMEL